MPDCVFCKIVSGDLPAMKLYEDAYTVAFMDTAADADGHLLVIPKAHCKSLTDCDEETLAHLMQAVKQITMHLTTHCGYSGVNLLHASGESAGQSVPHFHLHLIPRKTGDGIDAWPHLEGAKRKTEDVFREITML